MSGLLPYLSLQITAFAAVIALFSCFFRIRKPWWLLACLVYMLLDLLVLFITPQLPHVAWNWSGKIASAVLACIAIPLLRISPEEAGLTLPRSRSALLRSAVGTLLAVLCAVVISAFGRSHQWPSSETLWFEATMPGFSEELAYRCIAFALFARCFVVPSQKWAWIPPVLGPTLFFALGHGFTFQHFTPQIQWLPLGYAFGMGLILATIRLLSKRLLGSVIAHNAANLMSFVVDGI